MSVVIKVNKVSVEPSMYDVTLSFDGYEANEIIGQLGKEQVLDCFSTKEICSHYDKSELLDEMSTDFIKEYLKINGETEL